MGLGALSSVFLVLCQQLTAYRPARDDPLVTDPKCTFEAKQSDVDRFDVISVTLEDFDFTFFDSREFFLSNRADCNEKLDVKLEKMPNTTEAKRHQQEQRIKVKQIKEGLTAVKKQEVNYAKEMLDQLRSSGDEIPAVELHMFPRDPLDVRSKWEVLLIPKTRELFGKTVFLCRSDKRNEPTLLPCVAQLTFADLPPRLMHLFGDWNPLMDSLRGSHSHLLTVELLLITSLVLCSCQAAFPVLKSVLLAMQKANEEGNENHKSELDLAKLLETPLPKSCKLAVHAEISTDVDGDVPVHGVVLDAGKEVLVLEMKCSNSTIRGSILERIRNNINRMISSKPYSVVWGRLKEPDGWIILYDSARDWKGVVGLQGNEHAPYQANPQLMVPMNTLVCRQLVLATSHASVQWLFLENLVGLVPLSGMLCAAYGFFCVHMLVLQQASCTVQWGIFCDQVLEKERKRLRPDQSRAALYFCLLLTVVGLAIFIGASFGRAFQSVMTHCLAVLAAAALHAWDLHVSLMGLGKWREPQLACEFTQYPGEELPISDQKPLRMKRAREIRLLAVGFSTWFITTIGATIVTSLSLEALQMQGSLLDYSFSKGHLTYLAGAAALHNTLLLHDDSDSISFFFEGGAYAHSISLKLEHPQLNDSETVVLWSQDGTSETGGKGEAVSTGTSASGEYQLDLPAGPFYGRLTVEAETTVCFWTSCVLPSTRYTFHVIRVGEAISLSLKGKVTSKGSQFLEKRTWLYQQHNTVWYVPEFQEGSLAQLEVVLEPVCFAPLRRWTKDSRSSHLVHYAKECQCSEERARGLWIGSECSTEQQVALNTSSISTSICLFLRRDERTHLNELKVDGSKGRLSGKGLVKWLQNAQVSGKFSKLLADPGQLEVSDRQSLRREGWALKAQNWTEDQVSTVFAISLASQALRGIARLIIATTQDETDSEMQALLLRIVHHPPPIRVMADAGLILPDFDFSKRNEYFACGIPDLSSIRAEVDRDHRFHVEEQQIEFDTDCFSHPVTQKRFRAVRNDSCDYAGLYRSWNGDYDVAVTYSPQGCLNEAIDMGNTSVFHNISSVIPMPIIKQTKKACAVLQRAVRVDQWKMIPDIISLWGPNCANCSETPLGVAAAVGSLNALDSLLADSNLTIDEEDESHRTALLRAGQHCNVDAVKRLIDKNSNVNHLIPRVPGAKCMVTPLLWLLRHQNLTAACGNGGGVAGTLSTLLQMFANGGMLFVKEHGPCKQQTALVEAIESGNLAAVSVLLELEADPNQPGRTTGTNEVYQPLSVLAFQFLEEKIDWATFTEVAQLLVNGSADVNGVDPDGKTVLFEAAERCLPNMVKFLCKLGAKPEIQDQEMTAYDWTDPEYSDPCMANKTALNETRRLLDDCHH